MENAKSIELEEMRKEMESLKSVLKNQQIVNENNVRRAMSTTMDKEKKSVWVCVIIAIVATPICFFFFPKYGIPFWFSVVTVLFFAIAVIASIVSTRRLSSVSLITGNLLDVATKVTEYKRFGNTWLKFSIPFVTAWLAAYIYYGSTGMPTDTRYGFWVGCAIGLTFGIVFGIRYLNDSRRRLNDILQQIEELKSC
jgi:hypothetical protein